MDTVTADAWIQVVPETAHWNPAYISGAKAVRMGQRKPAHEKRIPGSVLMRVRLQIPKSVFNPIVETTIRINDQHVDVTVEQGEVIE